MNDAERSYYKIACEELKWIQTFYPGTGRPEFHNNIIAYHISEVVKKMMMAVIIDRSPETRIEISYAWLNKEFADLTGIELLVDDDVRFLERLNRDTENPGINFMNVSSEYITAAMDILNNVASKVSRVIDQSSQTEDDII